MDSPRDDQFLLHLHHRHQRRTRRDNPSFSSTLLDAIYRSIDEPNVEVYDQELIQTYRQTMRKKHQYNKEIEKWMEIKKISFEESKVLVRRKAPPPVVSASAVLMNSSSSSSESSCGGGFSSSESELSMPGAVPGRSRSSSSYCPSMQKPKPIRTTVSASLSSSAAATQRNYNPTTQKQNQSCSEGGGRTGGSFVKTKSKALKIYSDLKKVKQPISPGGRLASFLNSLFSSNSSGTTPGSGNAKKAKISRPAAASEPESSSACSSASSFSRSCLSKTPSSRGGKLSSNNGNAGGAKRSVRFDPVSVIVDEDCRPCGHKNLYENEKNMINKELQCHLMSERRRAEEAARELLKNYQKKKKEEEFDHHMDLSYDHDDDDDDDDDDAASCASSDLFELDNLSAIGGVERYREELPVYETTHLGTNRAIAATGLIL